MRLSGRVALISGGAAGVGAAAARLFAAEGARVGIADRDAEAGTALAAELEAAGHRVAFHRADVAVESEVAAAVAGLTEALGPPTALFAHAGTVTVKPYLDLTEADWDRLFAINVKGMFLVTRAALPHMLAAGGGAIVITSSVSAVSATPYEVLYDSTKGACHALARSLAIEFRDRNIRCNAVCPGFIRTGHGTRELSALRELGVKASEQDVAAAQGRLCTPEEVARAALFLLSDDASFITGTHLFVDNGYTAV